MNVKAVLIEDWRNLSDEERNVYIEKLKIENELLGDAYRHARKRKSKDETERKLKRTNIVMSVQESVLSTSSQPKMDPLPIHYKTSELLPNLSGNTILMVKEVQILRRQWQFIRKLWIRQFSSSGGRGRTSRRTQ